MDYSVAMCTYNGEKYLSEQLDSILNQSIRPKQIVISDDGSNDSTNEIICKYIKKIPEIQWKHKINDNNLGVIKNFEQAISLCDNEIIFLSDQDDIWLSGKVEKTLNVFHTNKYSVVFTDAYIVDKNCNKLGLTMFQKIDFNSKVQDKFHYKNWAMYLFLARYHATGATMAFKKSIVQKFMPFHADNRFYHDAWIATLAACIGDLTYIKEPLILYRQHENQQIGVELNTNTDLQPINKFDIIDSIITRRDFESVIYEFFKVNKDCISNSRFLVLQKRKRIYKDLINGDGSFFKRLLVILSIKPYIYKLPEFMGKKLFFLNSMKYLFSVSCKN